MPENNIQSRKSIHDRNNTPQREESDQDDGIVLESGRSINALDSGEEYEEKLTSIYLEQKTIKKRSRPPKETPTARASVLRNVSRPTQESPTTFITNNKPVSETGFAWKFALLCLTLVAVLAILFYQYEEKRQSCSFENLHKEYPEEVKSVWIQLQYGIEMILNKDIDKPAVFLLAHKGTRNSFNLIQKVAEKCSKCFGKRLLQMQKDDFVPDLGSDDYGYAIEKYKSKIKEGNVFFIADLNKIPARAARAFHAICDTHNPIRKSVVIFLALTVGENKKGNADSIAEETLRDMWGLELHSYELDPLITRITDQVIILKT